MCVPVLLQAFVARLCGSASGWIVTEVETEREFMDLSRVLSRLHYVLTYANNHTTPLTTENAERPVSGPCPLSTVSRLTEHLWRLSAPSVECRLECEGRLSEATGLMPERARSSLRTRCLGRYSSRSLPSYCLSNRVGVHAGVGPIKTRTCHLMPRASS